MRDLIDIIQILSEAPTLAPGEFKGNTPRWDTFISKIQNIQPFLTIDGDEVIIDPNEADRLTKLWKKNNFIGNPEAAQVRLLQPYKGKGSIRLSNLRKTTEFGGAAAAAGQPPTAGGKASYALTPQAIGITDRDIPASDLYDEIINNPVLKSTDYGQIVIQLANYIVSDESVSISPEVAKNKPLLAAIQDNAGEYLGVLALIYYRSRFPARKSFNEWLGGKTDELVLRFPKAANFALADSFASISNPNTNHSVNISSKGKDGGAAPAISGLKIPEHIKTDPSLKNAVDFVEICQTRSTLDQAFDGIDLLFKANKKYINEIWHQFLPFDKKPQIKQDIIASLQGKKIKFGTEWNSIINSVKSKEATPAGKIVYAIKKEVAEAINNRNALPEFKDMVLEILEMNFVQQYTDYQKKHKYEFTFETQWPAKLDGQVSLENKSSAKTPTQGGFSFKLGRTDTTVSDEPGEEPVDNLGSEEDFTAAASDISGDVPINKPEKVQKTIGDVGRKKR